VSVLYYFIIPEAILTVGIVLVAILSLQKQKISESKVDIQIGSLRKDEILKLSQGELKDLRKVVAIATGCLFIITLLVAVGTIIIGAINLPGLLICLLVQLLFSVMLGAPFMKRIRAFKQA